MLESIFGTHVARPQPAQLDALPKTMGEGDFSGLFLRFARSVHEFGFQYPRFSPSSPKPARFLSPKPTPTRIYSQGGCPEGLRLFWWRHLGEGLTTKRLRPGQALSVPDTQLPPDPQQAEARQQDSGWETKSPRQVRSPPPASHFSLSPSV